MPVPVPLESNVDVLVIGAGPSGVMCANALAVAGVNVRIVDQRSVGTDSIRIWSSAIEALYRPAKIPAGQADGIQPRTIEVFQVRRLGAQYIYSLKLSRHITLAELWSG